MNLSDINQRLQLTTKRGKNRHHDGPGRASPADSYPGFNNCRSGVQNSLHLPQSRNNKQVACDHGRDRITCRHPNMESDSCSELQEVSQTACSPEEHLAERRSVFLFHRCRRWRRWWEDCRKEKPSAAGSVVLCFMSFMGYIQP